MKPGPWKVRRTHEDPPAEQFEVFRSLGDGATETYGFADTYGVAASVAREAAAQPPRKPGAHLTKVDLTGLRLALQVLRTHAGLIDSAARDLGLPSNGRQDVMAALVHVVEEDHRSSETRGGS